MKLPRRATRAGLIGRACRRLRFNWARTVAYALAVVVGALIFGLVAGGRLPLQSALVLSVGLASVIVAVTLDTDALWKVIFFLCGCMVVVPQRFVFSVDLISIIAVALVILLQLRTLISMRDHAERTQPAVRLPAQTILLVIFLVLMLVSAIFNGLSTAIVAWLSGSFILLSLLVMPAKFLPSFEDARRALSLGMAVSVAYDLTLFLRGIGFDKSTFNEGRFGGSLGDYELVAEYYGVAVLLGVVNLVLDNSALWRLVSSGLVAGSAYLLVETESRGPILLLVIFVPAFLFMTSFKRESNGRRALMIMSMTVAAVLMTFGAYMQTDGFARFTGIRIDNGIASILNRESVWAYFTGLRSFVETGVLGNGIAYPYDDIGTYPHSLYLWVLWSFGYAGLGAFIVFLVAVLARVTGEASKKNVAGLAALLILGYVLLDQVKVEVARHSAPVIFFLIILSLAIVATRRNGTRA
jgi:hypothetical protein